MLLTLYLDVPSSYRQQFRVCFLALILLGSIWGGEREVIGLRDYGTAYVFRTGIGIRETFVRYFEI